MSAQPTPAGLCQPSDNRLHPFGNQLAHGNIVEEEQRLCAAAEDIVDAVVDQVHAYGIIPVHERGDFKLGAHAIGAGYQYRLGIALKLEQGAK